jgi:hypothetical protein
VQHSTRVPHILQQSIHIVTLAASVNKNDDLALVTDEVELTGQPAAAVAAVAVAADEEGRVTRCS